MLHFQNQSKRLKELSGNDEKNGQRNQKKSILSEVLVRQTNILGIN